MASQGAFSNPVISRRMQKPKSYAFRFASAEGMGMVPSAQGSVRVFEDSF